MKENFAAFSEITGHRRFLRGGSSILIDLEVFYYENISFQI